MASYIRGECLDPFSAVLLDRCSQRSNENYVALKLGSISLPHRQCDVLSRHYCGRVAGNRMNNLRITFVRCSAGFCTVLFLLLKFRQHSHFELAVATGPHGLWELSLGYGQL